MSRWRREILASDDAIAKNLYYGFCDSDGLFYVGTQQQLSKIGCINIRK